MDSKGQHVSNPRNYSFICPYCSVQSVQYQSFKLPVQWSLFICFYYDKVSQIFPVLDLTVITQGVLFLWVEKSIYCLWHILLKFFLLLLGEEGILPVCMCVHQILSGLTEARRGHQIFWNQSYTTVSPYMGTGKQKQVLCKSNKCP